MTDRKLLEDAAKAAGIDYHATCEDGTKCIHDGRGYWNPITDDGDALRLAVKMGMHVMVYADECHAVVWGDGTASDREAAETNKRDPLAATRRAITRAAAEIGKNV